MRKKAEAAARRRGSCVKAKRDIAWQLFGAGALAFRHRSGDCQLSPKFEAFARCTSPAIGRVYNIWTSAALWRWSDRGEGIGGRSSVADAQGWADGRTGDVAFRFR